MKIYDSSPKIESIEKCEVLNKDNAESCDTHTRNIEVPYTITW